MAFYTPHYSALSRPPPAFTAALVDHSVCKASTMPEAASKRQKLSSDAADPEQKARSSNSALQVCSNAPINLLIDGNMRGPRVRSGNPYLHRRPAGPASAASGANTRGRAPANPYAKPPPSKAAAEHSRRRLPSKKQLDSSLPVLQFQKQILVLSNMSDAEEAAAGLLAAQHAVVGFDLEWTAIRGAGRQAWVPTSTLQISTFTPACASPPSAPGQELEMRSCLETPATSQRASPGGSHQLESCASIGGTMPYSSKHCGSNTTGVPDSSSSNCIGSSAVDRTSGTGQDSSRNSSSSNSSSSSHGIIAAAAGGVSSSSDTLATSDGDSDVNDDGAYACYVFHLTRITDPYGRRVLPPSLLALLRSGAVLKAGVGVDGDMLRLQRDYAVLRNGAGPAGALELSRMAAQRGIKCSTGMWGLAALCEQVLKHHLPKPGNVRCSNWDGVLSQGQLRYAAGDAYACLKIYNQLQRQRAVSPTPHS
eukprot:TRINITY_DN193_c2_g1_i13.p1 TRINITY_DN193_c2_g1~~TRINITY_DN193_c2_g1_i13.p1  ORF type:complete len:479 (-),score=97.34 TRINITY_DN193_c2_g1_i13:183-1619(-)